jgi:hypothetical protein
MGCPLYSGCLDQSVNAGWESFSCMQCPLASRAEPLPHEVGRYAQQRKGDRYG